MFGYFYPVKGYKRGETIMTKLGMRWMVLYVLVLAAIGLAVGSEGNALIFGSQNTSTLNLAEGDASFPKASKPGLYVDNKIGFALPYPVEWASVKPSGREIFRAQPEARYPSVRAWFFPNFTMPLKNLSMVWTTNLKDYSKGEIKTIYDNETESSSGVVAHETELEWMTNEKTRRPDMKINSYYLALKNSKGWLIIGVYSVNGPVQQDIKEKVRAIQLKSQDNVS